MRSARKSQKCTRPMHPHRIGGRGRPESRRLRRGRAEMAVFPATTPKLFADFEVMATFKGVTVVTSRVDFDELVCSRQPVVYRPWRDADVTAMAENVLQHSLDKRLPSRTFSPRTASSPPPYHEYYDYLWTSLWSNVRKATIAELKASRRPWMISGIDLRAKSGTPVMAALDALMPEGASEQATGCWLSGIGCATAMHWDAFGPHNFHFLARGEKRLVLFAPEEAANIYCFGGARYLSRFAAAVDPTRPVSLECFPRYAHAAGLTATLREGDLVFIPAFWWHHLEHTG